MNIQKLKKRLKRLKIKDTDYSLRGMYTGNDEFCIEKVNSQEWEVYFAERGVKEYIKKFNNESDACIYFLGFILNDSSIFDEVVDNLDD